jgi:aminopeptidase 2
MQTKKYVATIQCHEVSHQWFGNITTMEWWDNLYLVRSCTCSSLLNVLMPLIE